VPSGGGGTGPAGCPAHFKYIHSSSAATQSCTPNGACWHSVSLDPVSVQSTSSSQKS